MAQTVYSGLQGSGKSYEVTRGVILPNVAKGRRVVTNVAGLQIEKINAYCVEKLGADSEKLGQIVHIDNEQVTKPGFFPVENSDNKESIVQGGDVVILDECWRWYVTGEKLPEAHLTFFRMHRHFTHPETGQSCDIVLIVQDIGDLQRKVLATVEKSFLMKKHKDLGMDSRYVVSVYSGKRQVKSALTEEHQEKYKPEIFELYSSYSQSTATVNKEEQADKRGNLFNRKLFKIGFPLAVIGIGGAIYNSYKFFHPDLKPVVQTTEQSQAVTPGTKEAKKPQESGLTDRWRLVGQMVKSGVVTFVLADSSGRLRYVVDPPAYKVSGAEVELALPNGEIVTHWTGASVPTLPGLKK